MFVSVHVHAHACVCVCVCVCVLCVVRKLVHMGMLVIVFVCHNMYYVCMVWAVNRTFV